MKILAVASRNPVKVHAARDGFTLLFPDESVQMRPVSVPSGVGKQPMTDEETLRGAANRARAAREREPEADFWMGIEGGVEDSEEGMTAFAWVVVLGSDGEGRDLEGRGRTGAFFLPPAVADLVRQGLELGKADDQIFGRSNSKTKEGAIGLLTDGAIDRAALYAHAVSLALVPFKKPELFRAP